MTDHLEELGLRLFPLTAEGALALHLRVMQDPRAWMLPGTFQAEDGNEYMVAMAPLSFCNEADGRELTEDELDEIEIVLYSKTTGDEADFFWFLHIVATRLSDELDLHRRGVRAVSMPRVDALVGVVRDMLMRTHAEARARARARLEPDPSKKVH